MTRQHYIMYVHPSFRITMTGNFAPILQFLKMLEQKEELAKLNTLEM